jgi:hypothetical protein
MGDGTAKATNSLPVFPTETVTHHTTCAFGESLMARFATKWVVPSLVLLVVASHSKVQAGVLQGEFAFEGKAPEVALVYFPEDKSLTATTPTLDQVDKNFAPLLVVGTKGAKIIFKNSDSISHNIFADDKDTNVKFDVGLLNAGSEASQDIDWENNVVKCSCKIHPQMRAWIASISSKYYRVIDLEKTNAFEITDVPNNLSLVKIWIPTYDAMESVMKGGESQDIELKKKSKVAGRLKLSRK